MPERRKYPVSLIAFLLLCMIPAVSPANSFKKLMMPGKLIEGHAKYENNCDNCHASFSKQEQSVLCLDCHKKIAADIKNDSGFHGRSVSTKNRDCKQCHTDHKGRTAVVVKLNKQTFNHEETDYPLRGMHRTLACASCHKADTLYRDTPSACISCHKKQDIHQGRLGKECERCHGESAWSEFTYDHDKTDFKLTGKHKQVQCNECHPSERYKNTPMQCYSCHALNDVHRGSLGKKCESCHGTQQWKKQKFDHNKDTDFPLHARHAEITCNACHKKDPAKEKTSRKCYSCHKPDDVHKGIYGQKCESCHTDRKWTKVTFSHDRDTDFALKGKHRDTKCYSCHKQPVAKGLNRKDCISCHKLDDTHKGQQGEKCGQCHNEEGWQHQVAFDHGLTKFPLLGLHSISPCEACHFGSTFKDAKTDCVSCHQKDDVHENRLGDNCIQCHNQNDWKVWNFDHNRQTDFELTGAHSDLDCLSCHTARDIREKPETECIRCHRADDKHNGNFGRFCEQCHTTRSFSDIRISR